MVGKKAPNFTLKSLDGKEVKFSQYKGKVVLLYFFSLASPANQNQLPTMERFNQKYRERGLNVIGLSVEKNGADVQKIAKQNQLSYPVLLDARRVLENYRLDRVPKLCLIGKDGVISAVYTGLNPGVETNLGTKIERLLKASADKNVTVKTSGKN